MTERRRRAWIAIRGGVALVLLLLGHYAVHLVFAGFRDRDANLSPHWIRLMGWGLPALLLGAAAWPRWALARGPVLTDDGASAGDSENIGDGETCDRSDRRDRSDRSLWRRGWIAFTALVVVFRVLPVVAGRLPQGLVWEEHEAAFAGRLVYWGIPPVRVLYGWTELAIAGAFHLFGIGEAALRIGPMALGVLVTLWFAFWTRAHWSAPTAIVCAALLATSPALAFASFFADEGFSTVVFLQIGLVATMLAIVRSERLWLSVVLGALCGMAVMEYAPIKPGIAVAPVVVYGALAAKASFTRGRRGSRLAGAVAGLYLCVLTVALTSAPMLLDFSRGGSEFFDGRRTQMIGSDWRESLETRLPGFAASLGLHLHALLDTDPDIGAAMLHPSDTPLAGALLPSLIAGALATLVVLLAVHPTGRRRIGRWARRHLGWLLLWSAWAAGAVFACALWNHDLLNEHRLLVVLPLLILVAGELFEGVFTAAPAPAVRSIVAAVIVLVVMVHGRDLWRATEDIESRYQYRSKTVSLCRELERLPPDERYLIHWDWTGGVYFGDTPMEEWIEDTDANGYDSWACERKRRLHGYDTLPALERALAGADARGPWRHAAHPRRAHPHR